VSTTPTEHDSPVDLNPLNLTDEERARHRQWWDVHGDEYILPPDPFVDWSTFWDRDHDEAEWLYADVLARGRGHSLYASRKEGKSLLMLWIAAALAVGTDPVAVVYLDYEMTEADLFERLDAMGYGPGVDLSRLRYALLPTLPPLDATAGAEALMALLDAVQGAFPGHHMVVIVDTIGRAVAGAEDEADTFRAFYNHTGIGLKRRGITWARLDHSGHDPKRPRGSSGKGDDVDVVWRLAKSDSGITLHRDLARMSWVPEKVAFGFYEEPLAFRRLADDWPDGTGETANLLDRLGVPLDAATREAQNRLRDIDEGRRRQLVVAAQRWRRERSALAPDVEPGITPGNRGEPLFKEEA